MKPQASVQQIDLDLIVTRLVDGPIDLVFQAWATPELFKRWWVPRSFGVTLQSMEADVRTGGRYRLVFAHGDSTRDFFGRYLEVTPPTRLSWTNDEGDQPGPITTVTFEARGAQTLVVVTDRYPSKAALDEGLASGATGALPETLAQLDELVQSLRAG